MVFKTTRLDETTKIMSGSGKGEVVRKISSGSLTLMDQGDEEPAKDTKRRGQ